ncbi:restriction endonuclease subunit S [Vibrio cholerae]|uniref:restriction endonuclease subunit S n=1 Tax=Vibrio cholerae TaxID=666 RepID=UPI000B495F47|nr:restriction endonuclease subunit S [Vibrio cholerae]ELJ8586028.1 restriction endonuclease subunit S [Vibrio cholerae]
MSNLKKHRFCDLYTMSSGISSTKEQAGHGSPFLSFSTVFNNYFVPDELTDLMSTSEKEKETYSIKRGDIFLTRTSEVIDELAMSCVAIKDYPNASYSGFLKRLRPTQTDITYSKFMAFYLRSPLFRKTMTNNAVMTLRASLNEDIFSYLDLLLPDFDEQVKAGDLLYLLNEKIEINNRINAELEGMAKTLYDYWFVQFEFPDNNGKPYKTSGGKMVYNAVLKRDIPDGWKDSVIENIIGKGPSAKKIPTKEYGNEGTIPIIDQSKDFICGFTCDASKKITPDIAHVIFGDHSRTVKLVNFEYARGADGTQVLVANSDEVPCYLLYQIVFDIDLSNYGYARHFKFLKESTCIVPEKSIARRYQETVAPWYEKIKNNILQNYELQNLRDWLLPMLMNGQVTVKPSTESQEAQHG